MSKLYKATYLYNGVHYEGNQRFEYGQPVIVDEDTARSLQDCTVIHTSYDAAGVGHPDPKKKFRLEHHTAPPVEVTEVEEPEADKAPIEVTPPPVVPPAARQRTAPAPT